VYELSQATEESEIRRKWSATVKNMGYVSLLQEDEQSHHQIKGMCPNFKKPHQSHKGPEYAVCLLR
jgi:hypothetical protein